MISIIRVEMISRYGGIISSVLRGHVVRIAWTRRLSLKGWTFSSVIKSTDVLVVSLKSPRCFVRLLRTFQSVSARSCYPSHACGLSADLARDMPSVCACGNTPKPQLQFMVYVYGDLLSCLCADMSSALCGYGSVVRGYVIRHARICHPSCSGLCHQLVLADYVITSFNARICHPFLRGYAIVLCSGFCSQYMRDMSSVLVFMRITWISVVRCMGDITTYMSAYRNSISSSQLF
ncbi:hypothetical protein Tco_0805633 [Tanacetum coccineum]